MKREITLASCAVAALLALRAPAQDPPPDDQEKSDLEERVESLEKALAVTVEQVDELGEELAATTALMDQTVRYLQGQALSAEEMAKTLDRSEAEGFTFGINPRSREILLAGWRERLNAARIGVPGAKAAEEAGANGTPVDKQSPAGGAR